MKSVLFVDDDPNVLAGLQNAMRRYRGAWSMRFALGAKAALSSLLTEPADAIVSDVRMPGIDGVELLRQVQRDYPDAARIILSGQADAATLERLSQVAHVYLAKPVDAAVIHRALQNALSVPVAPAPTDAT
jgi:DNA-binding NarL/FixJ family response regulator